MKFGTNIDLCYKEIQFARVHNVTADVDNPLVGQFFYRADTGDFVFFGKHGRQVFVDHNYFANTYIPWLNLNFSLATHNHNLNDLTEKSYNSLSDLPSLNFEPANANIQSHIADGGIHVTTVKTAAWDAKLDVSTSIPSLDTIDKRLTPAINEVNAIAKGAGNGETVTDIEALVILLNAAVPTDYPYGKNFYIIDTEVPDFWISVVSSTSVPYTYVDDTTFLDDIAVTGSLQIGYYSISVLEGQKVDLTDYYDKSAADLLLGAKEDITNKSSNVDTDKTSTTKYATVKAIYDWAVGKFIDLAKIVTSWSTIPKDTNIPSEKLVKDSLDLKAESNHNHNNVYEPANDNIQSHIGDGDIHVTSDEKSNWNGRISYSVTRDIDGNIETVTYANRRVVSVTRVAGLITKYEDSEYEYIIERTGDVFDGLTINEK